MIKSAADGTDQAAWAEKFAAISNLMSFQMQPFVTPILGVLDDNTGTHVGTGSYVKWRNRCLLLTNEHVASEISRHSLACKFFDCDDYFRVNNSFVAEGAPHDLAVSPVEDKWSAYSHSAMAFPDYRFDTKHNPSQRELLFLIGFAGEKAHYSPILNTLFVPGTPLLTQEYDDALETEDTRRQINNPFFDPKYHFALHWNPEATTPTDARSSSVPLDPHGMSGALVWNTRFVDFSQRGETWVPGVARLTGILWGWDTSERLLFATRIEHINAWLGRLYQ